MHRYRQQFSERINKPASIPARLAFGQKLMGKLQATSNEELATEKIQERNRYRKTTKTTQDIFLNRYNPLLGWENPWALLRHTLLLWQKVIKWHSRISNSARASFLSNFVSSSRKLCLRRYATRKIFCLCEIPVYWRKAVSCSFNRKIYLHIYTIWRVRRCRMRTSKNE